MLVPTPLTCPITQKNISAADTPTLPASARDTAHTAATTNQATTAYSATSAALHNAAKAALLSLTAAAEKKLVITKALT
jgi:hypothetical protein